MQDEDWYEDLTALLQGRGMDPTAEEWCIIRNARRAGLSPAAAVVAAIAGHSETLRRMADAAAA